MYILLGTSRTLLDVYLIQLVLPCILCSPTSAQPRAQSPVDVTDKNVERTSQHVGKIRIPY